MTKTALAAALLLAVAACGTDLPPVAVPVAVPVDVPVDAPFDAPVVEPVVEPVAGPTGDLWSAPTPDPYVAAIPSPTQLAVTFDTTPAAPAARAGALTAEVATVLESLDELSGARAAAAGIDQALAIARRLTPPAGSPVRDVGPGERAFGPTLGCVLPTGDSDCPANAQVESELLVRQGELGSYSWTLRVRLADVPGDWLGLYFGNLQPGEAAGSAQGKFVVALDALSQVTYLAPGSGRVLGAFVVGNGEQAFVYRVEDLVGGEEPLVKGRLYAHRASDGAMRIRFNAIRDVIPGPNGAEFVANHVGMTSRGGVGYEIISNWRSFSYRGDVPYVNWPGEAFLFVRSCFGSDRAPIYREIFTCPADDSVADCAEEVAATPLAGFEGGSWNDCAALTGDVTASPPESGAPAPWNESPEPGFTATPRPPTSPEVFEAELDF